MSPRPSHQVLWFTAAAGLGAVGICFLAAGLAASPIAWLGTLMIVAYACAAGAVVFFMGAARELRFPAARLPAEPSFPILPEPPSDDDPRSERGQALAAARPRGELGEALTANGVRPTQLHGFCATCGLPFDRPQIDSSCRGGAACAKRLEAPVARRMRIGGPLAVDPRWAAEHSEAG